MADEQQAAAESSAALPSWVPLGDDQPNDDAVVPSASITPQASPSAPQVTPSVPPPPPVRQAVPPPQQYVQPAPPMPRPPMPPMPQQMPPGQYAPGPPPVQHRPPALRPQVPGVDNLASMTRTSMRQRWRGLPGFGRRGVGQTSIHEQLLARVNQPIRGDYRIAVLSLKGGVGKTTTTIGLGATFATLRGDRVIAVDANPDLGTLAQRVPLQTNSTVRDLIADTTIQRYSDVRAHTSQAPNRLEVLASERDPAQAESFSEDEYRQVMAILQRYYNIILTDCGTGLSHSAMRGVLDLAHSIILVTSPALDGARSADATLDWLQAHGYGHLVSNAVLVISSSRAGSSRIDADQLAQHFLTKCRAVHELPYDEHLAEGSIVDLDQVSRAAREALTELSATIADDMGRIN